MRAGRTKTEGIAMVVVMSVLVLLLIIVVVVADQGVGSLVAGRVDFTSKRSVYAAEAGVAAGLRALVLDHTYQTNIPKTAYTQGAVYSLEVVNNFAGPGVKTASNGASVPAGLTYLLGRGSREDGAYAHQVGVMVRANTGSAFPFAAGAGSTIDIGGGAKNIAGTLRANVNIHLVGRSRIVPQDGNGSLLSAGTIDTNGRTDVDPSQAVRARGSVSGNFFGNPTISANDNTPASLPMINDGRTSNTGGGNQPVMPYPDLNVTLGLVPAPSPGPYGPNVVAFPGVTTYSGTLDLANKVLYFPDGITFSHTTFTGTGTILVTNGNSIKFQGGAPNLNANLLAMRNPGDLTSGTPTVDLGGGGSVHGLILSSQDVDISSSTVQGMVVAYKGNITGHNSDIIYDPSVLGTVPGLASWATAIGITSSGSGPVYVNSWQRL